MWVTLLLTSFIDIKNIKMFINDLPWEVLDYTEGVLPMRHLSILFSIVEEDEDVLIDSFDVIMTQTKSIDLIVYGSSILEYCLFFNKGFFLDD